MFLAEGEGKRQGTGGAGTINATGPRQVTIRRPEENDQSNEAWKERAATDEITPTGDRRKANETGDRKAETTNTDPGDSVGTPNTREPHNWDPENPSQAGDSDQGRPTRAAMI